MSTTDIQGYALSGANGAAAEAFEQASHEFRCFIGDPMSNAQRAVSLSNEMPMAHALIAWLSLLGTDPAGLEHARQALTLAKGLPTTEREGMHLKAVGELINGHWHAAGRTLEDLSIRWPHDVLALQAGHQIDFFTGQSRMLRDRIARALPHWQEGRPGRHAVLGMLAFGLEEMGDYAQAERLGRQAVALERRDGWAWHAVAHVMEMQSRRRDGVAWLREDQDAWVNGSFFAIHNSWHLALFHLGLEEVDTVLELMQDQILGTASAVVVDMIDASAMLWRLELRGMGVAAHWNALADRWSALAENSTYAFNDMHAMMAFVGAGREREIKLLLGAQQRALQSSSDNVGFLRDVGNDATQAIIDFGQGRYGECVQRLRRVRPHAHRFGGSHAQRDLIDLTLIAAAERDGQSLLAQALQDERAVRDRLH